MKHLKRFNESINKEEELKSFCEDYLAYLLDEGFEISVQHRYSNKEYKHDYHFITINNLESFPKWEEIKDHFIPFISVLSKEYELGYITFYGIGKEPVSKLYYTRNIVNDYINFKFPIDFITIVVK